MKITLKQILTDQLRVKGILSREDLKRICRVFGYEESNGERRMRSENNTVPHIKLNVNKKPCRVGEWVAYYKWDGGKTQFKTDYEEQSSSTTRKTPKKKRTNDERTREKVRSNSVGERKT